MQSGSSAGVNIASARELEHTRKSEDARELEDGEIVPGAESSTRLAPRRRRFQFALTDGQKLSFLSLQQNYQILRKSYDDALREHQAGIAAKDQTIETMQAKIDALHKKLDSVSDKNRNLQHQYRSYKGYGKTRFDALQKTIDTHSRASQKWKKELEKCQREKRVYKMLYEDQSADQSRSDTRRRIRARSRSRSSSRSRSPS